MSSDLWTYPDVRPPRSDRVRGRSSGRLDRQGRRDDAVPRRELRRGRHRRLDLRQEGPAAGRSDRANRPRRREGLGQPDERGDRERARVRQGQLSER